MKRSTIWAIVAVLVLAGSIAAYLNLGPKSDPQSSVKIALNIPMSGPIAGFSGEYANGLKMGIDDGAKELGVPVTAFMIDAQDNAGNPSQAVTVMQKQKIDGFDVYVSGVSQMSVAVARDVDATGKPHLVISYDDELTAGGPNRLRVLPSFKLEGPVYAAYARKRQAKRVYAITLNNPEIQREFDKFVEGPLRSEGVAFTREIFDFGQTDFSTLASKVKAAKPDLILISGFSINLLPVVKALRSQGLIADGNVLAIMDFNELLSNGTPRSDLAGIAFISPPYLFPTDDPARATWAKRYQERFKVAPGFVPAYAYDTGRIIVATYKNEHSVTRAGMLKQLPYQGITGSLQVDSEGDLNTPLGILKVQADGALVKIPE